MVRHRSLTCVFVGSNPASPVKISVLSTLYFLYPFLGNFIGKEEKMDYVIKNHKGGVYKAKSKWCPCYMR